ncbi:MAG: hypothetical protein JJU36_08865 [Phycisphaeraceae bacterium]|nr:hypothetical protein [Phycisphaeraceae bacterium]
MSQIVVDMIELQTNDATKQVRLSQVEKYGDGCFRCDLSVRSGGFSCQRPFYFDDVVLAEVVPALRTMAATLSGKCIIKGQWEVDYLAFEVNEMGHVFISGEIFEHQEFDQRLRFAFRTDQTVLLPLASELQLLLDA